VSQEQINHLISLCLDDLPTECDIMAEWKGDLTNPDVSIICNTYNHRGYIEDALKGFLIQKTDFPFEIIVHDDASSDGTTDIVKKYQKRYPHIINLVVQAENQFSKGNKPMIMSFPYSRGNLVAICEGDDFWFSTGKLAQQKAALDKNPKVDLCIHPATKINLKGEVMSSILGNERRKLIYASEVIRAGGGWCATCSIVVRRQILQRYFDNFKTGSVGDVFIQSLGSIRGGALNTADNAAAYRVGVSVSWSKSFTTKEKVIENHESMQKNLSKLGRFSDFSRNQKEIDILKSRCSYNAAIRLLRLKQWESARLYITESLRHSVIGKKQIILYIASRFLGRI